MTTSDKYVAFYINKGDSRGLGGNFKSLRVQRGDGLGSFLAGAWRKIFPLFKSGALALGDQALNAGIGLLRDSLNGKNLRDSVRGRVEELGSNLTKRAAAKMESMVGSGLKGAKRRKVAQSKRKRPAKRKKVSSTRKRRDIFS